MIKNKKKRKTKVKHKKIFRWSELCFFLYFFIFFLQVNRLLFDISGHAEVATRANMDKKYFSLRADERLEGTKEKIKEKRDIKVARIVLWFRSNETDFR